MLYQYCEKTDSLTWLSRGVLHKGSSLKHPFVTANKESLMEVTFVGEGNSRCILAVRPFVNIWSRSELLAAACFMRALAEEMPDC